MGLVMLDYLSRIKARSYPCLGRVLKLARRLDFVRAKHTQNQVLKQTLAFLLLRRGVRPNLRTIDLN
jgi:hypothetical protein